MIKYFKIMLIILLASQAIECSTWNTPKGIGISMAFGLPIAAASYYFYCYDTSSYNVVPYPNLIMLAFTGISMVQEPLLNTFFNTGVSDPSGDHSFKMLQYSTTCMLLAVNFATYAYCRYPKN